MTIQIGPDESWFDFAKRLEAENAKLRDCLIGTRYIVELVRGMAPPEMGTGFDMWLAKINEALK